MLCKRLQQTVQHARSPSRIARRNQQCCLVIATGCQQVAADDEETGRIIRTILNIVYEDLEFIHVGCDFRSDRGGSLLVPRAASAVVVRAIREVPPFRAGLALTLVLVAGLFVWPATAAKNCRFCSAVMGPW